MKIAIVGGTCDPVHDAHIGIAQAAQREPDFNQTWVMPAGKPHHKNNIIASSKQRIEMVKLALRKVEGVIPSDFEIERDYLTNSESTFSELRKMYPGIHFEMVMGSDSFFDLPNWRDIDKLIASTAFVVARRTEITLEKIENLKQALGRDTASKLKFRTLANSVPNTSSTEIKKALKNGLTPNYLDPAVLDFIRKNNLYI